MAPPETAGSARARGRVVFRYCDRDGTVTDDANPNGSISNIAGIMSEGGNVVGLMPHPERAAEAELISQDGLPLLEALIGLGSIAVGACRRSAASGVGLPMTQVERRWSPPRPRT